MMVSRAPSAFDQNDVLIDSRIREQLREFMHGFVAFANSRADRKSPT
jgi:hypothetical protein